ncbi:MAG: hypothetical protein FD138_1542 [Planctomycetota bacterium]|nr:MAG: hypothetical protein FD138_1542 [Planctomycetota bacterium]
MTNLDTQTLVALVCVTVALAVLCRRTILWWNGQSPVSCGGGCHGCGSEPAKLKVPLTVIDIESSTATVKERPAPSQEAAP